MGQLGLNQGNGMVVIQVSSSPKQIPGDWDPLSCTAIKTDGTLWVWGWNEMGACLHGDQVLMDQGEGIFRIKIIPYSNSWYVIGSISSYGI